MKFKILMILLIALNLTAQEILTPQEAIYKLYDYKQINEYPADHIYDYQIDTTIKPSFKCSNKFEKYSLEDFICNSNFNAFRDNYFTSLYNTIIKQNPKLKDKALKIARERIKETKKDCMTFTFKEYEKNIELGGDFISSTIGCIAGFYDEYSSKLALMLYDNDKELFKKIFGDGYEKFKEVFDDTLTISAKYYKKEYEKFKEKYEKEYDVEYGKNGYYILYYQYGTSLIYILSIQYNLIDSTGKFK